jgi:hypothetical protein
MPRHLHVSDDGGLDDETCVPADCNAVYQRDAARLGANV